MRHQRVAYDAIVVGGGHNGLVCAAYLAGGGLRTVVLERRSQAGGMAGTSELAAGARIPVVADTVGRLRPSVARELRLREHGLSLVQPDVRVFAPRLDGPPLTLWGDAERTAEELVRSGLPGAEADAAGYAGADDQLRALGSALATLLARTPPDLTHASLGDALSGLATGLRARSRMRTSGASLLRVLPMSVHDLLGDWLANDALRAAIATRAIRWTALAPRMPGTAQLLLADAAAGGGLAGNVVFARGGPGALADALVASARGLGGEVRTGVEVARIRHDHERVAGVTLADGAEIDAPIVVSGVDPKRPLLGLLAPEAVGPRLSWRASNIRSAGATAKVNLALRELPRFTGLADGEAPQRLRGRIVIAPSLAYLERAVDAAKYGRIADEPYLEATIPSLVDPSLLEGSGATGHVRHVMSVLVQAAPYHLRDADWDEQRGALADAVVRTLEAYAPGFSDLVEARQVITPLDLERDYGATEGHPLHAEAALDQWFAWRPLHGLGRYRLPLAGLYLCGSGAHPGGGITGGPGLLAAREILADVAGHGASGIPPDRWSAA